MTASEMTEVRLADGRMLEVLLAGPRDGVPLVFHFGTPSAAVPFPPVTEAAARRNLRTISCSRPGYGSSTPMPGRSVADVAGDMAQVLDGLGAGRFITAGWSGGGPHALACAALLPDRCMAAATVAGVAPYPAEGRDWLAGMGPENVEEFGATLESEAALTAYLERSSAGLATIQGDDIIAAMGGLLSPVDKAALTGELAGHLAAAMRSALSNGVAGWRDDDLAFAHPWGFDLAAMTTPVALWQGGEDLMVPSAHASWLKSQIPTARLHSAAGEGHVSLIAAFGKVLDDLLEIAGLPRTV